RSAAHRAGRVWPAAIGPAVLVVIGYAAVALSGSARPLTTLHAATLPGMASLSGTVESSKPFQAAQVYIRNVDKRILYMVYTKAGQYRAASLFPGNYEVNVVAKELKSDVKKLMVKAGDSPKLNLSLHEATAGDQVIDAAQNLEGTRSNRVSVTFDSYDNVYPPGPGRAVAERTCIVCHGENFLPSQPGTAQVWNSRIDRMMGKNLFDKPAASYAEGLLSYRAQWLLFNQQDRQDLVDYLVKHFGPGAKPRNVRTDPEPQLDEAKLGKAMYMEYYVADDPPGQGVHSP